MACHYEEEIYTTTGKMDECGCSTCPYKNPDGCYEEVRQEVDMMEIGNVVKIKENDSCLDCCTGKRGRIAHIGVDGGFLLCTDHFCPIERTEEELELIPIEVLAREVLEDEDLDIVAEYMKADVELLREYAPVDMLAAAVLVLRGGKLQNDDL